MIALTHSYAYADTPETTHNAHLYEESQLHNLNEDVANQFMNTLAKHPRGLFFLSAGPEMTGVYKAFVEAFQKNPTLNLSQASFFLIDDFDALGANHPLSHSYFLQIHLYEPLMHADKKRAPNPANCFAPQDPSFSKALQTALEHSDQKRPHLALLTIGSVSPHKNEKGFMTLKGGKLGALEPGEDHDFFVKSITLSGHRQGEIAHRFRALEALLRTKEIKGIFSTHIPEKATTLGWTALKNCDQILVVATGEDKNPAIADAFGPAHFENFTSSLLSGHPQVSWYLDQGAASSLTQRPWHTRSVQTSDHIQILCESAQMCGGKPLKHDDLAHARTHQINRVNFDKAHTQIKERIQKWICDKNFPQNQRVLILSPHPDDDVISMGGAIKRLVEKGNDVRVIYAVTGANAVANNLPAYAKFYQEVVSEHPNRDEKARIILAKTLVREEEAKNAIALLGLGPDKLTFFKADYYQRRGVPNLSPFSQKDLSRMKDLIKDLQPEVLFFAAENDPNGAHGLSTQLMAITLDSLIKEQNLIPPKLYGYRGAYAEWPLHTKSNLMIYAFGQKDHTAKERAIKAHVSQLDPLYPSFDPRPFYKRASDRNEASLKQITALLGSSLFQPSTEDAFVAAEVFQEFSAPAFILQYR